MNTRCVALALALFLGQAREISALPSIVAASGRQLLVQKRNADGTLAETVPYVIRGLNWSPASTNTVTSSTDPDNVNRRRPEFRKWHAADLPLLKGINANTVRVPMDFGVGSEIPGGLAILDACYASGIMVVMTVDNGINDTGHIFDVVTAYREHPAILAWALGNEWNINRYYGATGSVLEAARRTESAAILVKNLDPNHPVVSSYGEIDIDVPGLHLADTARYVNEVCPSVDLWALNIYRGKSFGSLFAQWAGITAKPMFLGEFGIDAFHSDAAINPNPTGTINEAEQADWNVALWRNLSRNLSARDPNGVAIGGLVHEFNDQWWKIAPTTSQQTGGLISATGFPDGMSSEEIFGVCDIFRKPRAAYHALRTAFDESGAPPGQTLAVTTLANSGPGSLRQAVADARSGDAIVFAMALSGTINLATEIRIDKDLAISGPGANRLTLNGNGTVRLFNLSSNIAVRLSALSLTRGGIGDLGGAILNRGSLEVADCRFVNNFAGISGDGAGQGGAIYNAGNLLAERCAFTDNRATGNGGAIRSAGDFSIRNCYFQNNRATYFGGAIFNFTSGAVNTSLLTNNAAGPSGGGIWNENGGLSVTDSTLARNSAQQGGGLANKNGSVFVVNSTFSGNSATVGGGGIFNGVFNESGGSMFIANSTIASNNATSGAAQGGGLRIGAGSVTIRSSLIAGNGPTDIGGAVISGGFNLVGNGSAFTGIVDGSKGDQSGTGTGRLDPRLGPLRDNSGPAPTHALSRGSPAIDRGNSFGRGQDQRGELRFDDPALPNAPGGDGADIGACEASQPRITSAQRTVEGLRFEFISALGAETVLQSRTPSSAVWSNASSVAGTGGKLEWVLPAPVAATLFRLAVP